ncbi:spindle pole body component 110-like [Dorcoceras hygrometricum]|uniref:Spindle pole body component 110-like n=1 Tax=Dorcoceras hygrometricum TaxID=472368 RepID=A0A2Z7BC20_9LAMI|nr:spindle pole body component 110-like [Dorcoceras hygrometricum]
MVAEENKSAWADSDSEESRYGTSSSSESEDEVQCLMADDTEEVFDFSSPEFTREDLVTALNEMVLEYKKRSQSFDEVKSERESCAANVDLVGSSNMQAALSKLVTENEELRSRSEEMRHENQWLAAIISSRTRSYASLKKLHETTKPSGDKIGLGYNSDEGSTAETNSTPRLENTKFETMNFVKSSAG